MNMSGMAGLGVTDPNWKYTGPALPAAEVAELTTVSATTDQGHKMQTPNCDAKPTSDQVLGATQYVQATSAAVAKYRDLSAAEAAGLRSRSRIPNYPVVHYLNPAYMNMKDVMNPTTVDSLVYATTPYGPVLVAAMYLMPGPGNGPMPYGCLVQWHAHTNLCTSATTHQIDGFTPCAPGSYHDGATPMMTHVWQVPVSGGPLAMDPSDLQVVEAAIMAQQQGWLRRRAGSRLTDPAVRRREVSGALAGESGTTRMATPRRPRDSTCGQAGRSPQTDRSQGGRSVGHLLLERNPVTAGDSPGGGPSERRSRPRRPARRRRASWRARAVHGADRVAGQGRARASR